MQRLIGPTQWKRETAPIRAEMLAEMDGWHQRRLLGHTTHCQLWKRYRGRVVELVTKFDELLITTLDAREVYFAAAAEWGYETPSAKNWYLPFYRGPLTPENRHPAGQHVHGIVSDAHDEFNEAARAFFRFIRQQSGGRYDAKNFPTSPERPPLMETMPA
ncbi:hypothetical protein [Devosia sp. A449]